MERANTVVNRCTVAVTLPIRVKTWKECMVSDGLYNHIFVIHQRSLQVITKLILADEKNWSMRGETIVLIVIK